MEICKSIENRYFSRMRGKFNAHRCAMSGTKLDQSFEPNTELPLLQPTDLEGVFLGKAAHIHRPDVTLRKI
ncbi:hypothetical protein [Pseudomonas aeruginosa]|uniref:hypothetical protein n=1 Tax=Pseudomonas aeruginosa TaxID=287 RepID=UPI0013CE3B86|nr:hypothetical protein [Pseudomonas aeruginosa]